jgi:hypothetical protein
MSKGVSSCVMGMFILALALALWKITASPQGWAVLFLPGAFLVMRGVYVIIRDEI